MSTVFRNNWLTSLNGKEIHKNGNTRDWLRNSSLHQSNTRIFRLAWGGRAPVQFRNKSINVGRQRFPHNPMGIFVLPAIGFKPSGQIKTQIRQPILYQHRSYLSPRNWFQGASRNLHHATTTVAAPSEAGGVDKLYRCQGTINAAAGVIDFVPPSEGKHPPVSHTQWSYEAISAYRLPQPPTFLCRKV